MFQSATLKLTAWYAGILIVISIIFSIAIYEISLGELNARITHFQGLLQSQQDLANQLTPSTTQPTVDPSGRLRKEENNEASEVLIVRLVYINIIVLAVGSLASYLLARRTLRPVQEAHEAQARFVTDTSHELRTPLAIMKSELEVSIRDKDLSKAELHSILKSNLEEVESLSRMSEMLLAMSSLDHKKLSKQPLDLKLIASEAVYRFKKPTSRLLLTGKSVKVLGNETSLIELMSILIENALKYSPATSTVRIRVGADKHHAFFTITNEGKGIAPEALDHIFERFYRADSSRTHGDDNTAEQKGFGLGLSIAKQIAILHGGEITATSAPDDITEFSYFQQTII